MYSKTAILATLATTALAGPVRRAPVTPRNIHGVFNQNDASVIGFNSHNAVFNNFGGLQSLGGFDNWFGQGNFCGQNNVQVIQQNVVQCQVTPVQVIQQQLAVVSEYVKRVILTQQCDVESQVVLYSQWLGGLVQFGQDLRHVSHRVASFDGQVASHIGNLIDHNGNIITSDFGFGGHSIGGNSITVIGNNWDNSVSPLNVGLVWDSCVAAAGPSIPLGVSCDSQICQQQNVIIHQSSSSGCIGESCGSSCIGESCGGSISSSGCIGESCGGSISSSGCIGESCGNISSSSCIGESCGGSISSSGCIGESCGNISSSSCIGESCGGSISSSGCIGESCGNISSSSCIGESCGGSISSSGCIGESCGSVSSSSGCIGESCGQSVDQLPPVSSGSSGSVNASGPEITNAQVGSAPVVGGSSSSPVLVGLQDSAPVSAGRRWSSRRV